MTTPQLRCFPALGCFLLLLLISTLIGCGNNSSSMINNNGPGTPTPGSSNPGGGGTGGGASSPATYVYAGDAMDAGGAFGWRLDPTGNLIAVAGSPFLLSSGGNLSGPLVAVNGFVYVVNRPSDTSGAAIYTFKSDAGTGALTVSGSAVTITTPGESDVRRVVLDPLAQTSYAVTQFTVSAIALNNGSPAMLNSQSLANGEIWGFAASNKGFAYAGIQDGNPKQGFDIPVIKRVALGSNGSLNDAGTVVATLLDANIPSDLAVDASGKYVAATTGLNDNGISVWTINGDGSLTPVPGSPFSNNNRLGRWLSFDPSGGFLYVLNNEEAVPNQENITVFSVGSNGALTQVQSLDLASGVRSSALRVESDFTFVVNDSVGGVAGSITVFRRDSSSGQLTVVGTTDVSHPLGHIGTLHFTASM